MYKEPHSARTQRIFDNGHGVHERITQELRDAGILVREEVPISCPEHLLAGHTDGIGCLTLVEWGGLMVILEIKSIGEKGYRWIVGGGEKFYQEHGADPKHRQQVQLYMYMTGILYALIIYENKNTQERAYYVELRDLELINGTLLPKVDLINAHVKAGTLPPRGKEYPPKCFECQWCDYAGPCLAEESTQQAGGIIDLIAIGESCRAK